MGEEKAEEIQAAEEILAGGESAARDEDATSSNSLDFIGDSTVVDQAPPHRLGTTTIPGHKRMARGERLPIC